MTQITTSVSIYGYVDGISTQERLQHTVSHIMYTFKYFKGTHDITWGRPLITIIPAGIQNSIHVYVGYYVKSNQAFSSDDFQKLRSSLNPCGQTINNNQSVQLTAARLSGPYMDATILGQVLSRNLRLKRFWATQRRMQGTLGMVAPLTPIVTNNNINGPILPVGLVGIKVGVNGRLTRESSRPRFTEQLVSVGALTADNYHVLDSSAIPSINKKNAYTTKVSIVYRL
jgi:hypothetical protein